MPEKLAEESFIAGVGARMDAIQSLTAGKPGQPAEPGMLQTQLQTVADQAQNAGLESLSNMALTASRQSGKALQDASREVLTELRKLATGRSSPVVVMLYIGNQEDVLSKFRACTLERNALILQVRDIEQARRYIEKTAPALILLDHPLKESASQDLITWLHEDYAKTPYLSVCAKKPKTVLRQARCMSWVDAFIGPTPDQNAFQDMLNTSGCSVVARRSTDYPRKILSSKEFPELFHRQITTSSSWCLAWLDAIQLSEEALKELKADLLGKTRQSDLSCEFSDRQFVLLLQHTKLQQAHAAMEKFFVKALKPPRIDPLRIAIIQGNADSDLDTAVDRARALLDAEKSLLADPVLASEPGIPSDDRLQCLLVDPNPALLRTMSDLSRGERMIFSQAHDSAEALDKTSTSHPYRCILVSDDMIEKEGLDWVTLLRKRAVNRRIPILGIVEHNGFHSEDALYAAGVTHILRKPIHVPDLADTVTTLLGSAASSQPTTVPDVLLVGQDTKAILAHAMSVYREIGVHIRLAKTWQDALQRMHEKIPTLVIAHPNAVVTETKQALQAARDFSIRPNRGYIYIAPNEHLPDQNALDALGRNIVLSTTIDPLELATHVRIQLNLSALRRFPANDREFQLEVNRVMRGIKQDTEHGQND